MTTAVRLPWRREFAAALVLAAAATLCLATGVAHRFDLVLYDRLIAFDRPAAHAEIAIVAIDERSLKQLGRWPWPRTTHARLLDRLREAQTRAVALQVIFAEPADADADGALVQAVARHGRVVLPVFPERDGLVPGGSLGAALPLPELARAARLGHVDTELDEDGLARAVYLKAGIDDGAGGGRFWPHLGLAMIETGLAESSPELAGKNWRGQRRPDGRPDTGTGAAANHGARGGAVWVRDVRALVPFAPTAFTVVSYADVLSDPRAAAALRGKLVLVGATAAGAGDELATPLQRGGARMPGVEFNAHVASALLQDRLIAPLPFAPTLALTLAVPLLVLWGSSRVRRTWVPTVTLGGVAVVLVLTVALLRGADTWFAAASSLAGVLLSYPLWTWLRMQRDAEVLAVEKTQLNATLQSIGDAVITTDTAGRVVFMNPVAEALVGVPLAQARQRHLDDLVSFEDDHGAVRRPAREVLLPATQAALAAGVHGRLTVRPGYTRVVRVCGRPVRAAPDASVGGVVLAVTDLSDLAAMTARIEHQATHDALTGLPNRLLLRDRVEQALARARRAPPEAREVAVLFIDLDHFKRVNDSLGHSEGDVLLREVAHRLSATVRAGDTVARWGGDEFVVLLDGIPARAAAEARAQALCESLRAPGGGEYGGTNGDAATGASIGVALFPNDGDDADTLFRHADAAMYAAKAAGRNTVSFYSAQMHEIANERLALERALRGAVARNEFELHYQPQVNLEDGRIVGAEALVRWRHPDAGLLPPKHFIELAEETGLIQDIGAWAIGEACRVLRTWRAAGLPSVTVAVNVSPRQLAHPQFEATVRAALDREDIGEGLLKLEITESVLATDVERSAALLARLRARGVAVAIDDFGVGYSSLRYLKQFPVSELKIDPLFVNQAAFTSQDAAMIDAIVALARGLDLTVIAEGIETEEQLAFLRERGCRFGQGFLFARPLPLFEVARLIAAGDPLPLR